ncbi:MAG TPA: acylphosphatase [Acidimicrobiales bacterium]|nr:acylphosphatase [Acidimicrobiales bacterium]
MAIRRHVYVSGRVQGVFFRDTCARQAHQEGVTGWVRNRWDGQVEAVFEGQLDAVERMVEWCRHGPSRAIVTSIKIDDEPVEDEPYFRIY